MHTKGYILLLLYANFHMHYVAHKKLASATHTTQRHRNNTNQLHSIKLLHVLCL